MPAPRATHALAAYVVLALAATWPLVLGLGRDVPWDLGDSLLVMWILAWDCEQVGAILRGDFGRLATFFDANIFHPMPLTLAYSDHLLAQAVQGCPVYAASANPILVYNLLFLSTTALSGLGMYLLVRELTGNPAAGFVAGLLFAFAPYRLPASSHLQMLSSQWMPFFMYGTTRYFATGRVRPLAGGAAALVLQNLSSGYHLFYFGPWAAVYVLWEVWRRQRWRDRRLWLHLMAAASAVCLFTLPPLLPYVALRAQSGAMRPEAEVIRLSADIYSYGTAFGEQRIWGSVLRAFPKPEGDLFPGLVPLLLAAVGIATGARWPRPRGWLPLVLAGLAVAHAAAAFWVLLVRRVAIDLGWFALRMSDVDQLLLRAAIALALLLAVSPRTRAAATAFMQDRGFFIIALAAAVWLSLGPLPLSQGRPIDLSAPYRLLYEHVPGYDGLRVPARFAVFQACLLAVLGGFGAAALVRRTTGRALLAAGAVFFLVEATHVPYVVNGTSAPREYAAPEPRVYRPGRAPAVYRELARQPRGSVLVELPFGQPDYDLRATFYSMVHWQRLVNGYSGLFPAHYGSLITALSEIPRHPDVTAAALRSVGATHIIVHEAAYLDAEGAETSAVLRHLGALEIFREGPDVLLELPR